MQEKLQGLKEDLKGGGGMEELPNTRKNREQQQKRKRRKESEESGSDEKTDSGFVKSTPTCRTRRNSNQAHTPEVCHTQTTWFISSCSSGTEATPTWGSMATSFTNQSADVQFLPGCLCVYQHSFLLKWIFFLSEGEKTSTGLILSASFFIRPLTGFTQSFCLSAQTLILASFSNSSHLPFP